MLPEDRPHESNGCYFIIPEVTQKYLIPFYQVGNQWSKPASQSINQPITVFFLWLINFKSCLSVIIVSGIHSSSGFVIFPVQYPECEKTGFYRCCPACKTKHAHTYSRHDIISKPVTHVTVSNSAGSISI